MRSVVDRNVVMRRVTSFEDLPLPYNDIREYGWKYVEEVKQRMVL
jgi:hypothetical protein